MQQMLKGPPRKNEEDVAEVDLDKWWLARQNVSIQNGLLLEWLAYRFAVVIFDILPLSQSNLYTIFFTFFTYNHNSQYKELLYSTIKSIPLRINYQF